MIPAFPEINTTQKMIPVDETYSATIKGTIFIFRNKITGTIFGPGRDNIREKRLLCTIAIELYLMFYEIHRGAI
jgi:hypothetical protein